MAEKIDEEKRFNISSFALHILAMALMFCDHAWATVFPSAEWLTCIGRLAFPIFAFMTAEGFSHTHDLKRYMLRIFVWACVSEIPFNIMYGGSVFYPFHQNVLWTFLESLFLIFLIEKCKRFKTPARIALYAVISLFGFVLGYVTMVDYYGAGVLTVLVFHFFRERTWKNRLIQFVCLYFLNVELLGGYCYVLNIFGYEIEIVQQGLALLALIPIWLYRGRQGFHNKIFQYACYAFYPVHIILLALPAILQ
ncbi:MAG: conjugal transfer protein TraX [Ruminococcaceae bacterium]|nr:conjugal transfer protein TraX [Oscillospiraceae bacterium]